MRRKESARPRIQEDGAIDGDAATPWAKQSGDHIENAGLPRTRRAVNGRHPAVALEARVESEVAETRLCRHFEAHTA